MSPEASGPQHELDYQETSFIRRIGRGALVPVRYVMDFLDQLSVGMGVEEPRHTDTERTQDDQ